MMPVGAPYVVYTHKELGVADPVAYTVSFNVHHARIDGGVSFTGHNPDEEGAAAVPMTDAVWLLSGGRYNEFESKAWPPVHGQVRGSRISIKFIRGDAIDPGYSAGSLESEKFAAIEHIAEPVKRPLGKAVPSVVAEGA